MCRQVLNLSKSKRCICWRLTTDADILEICRIVREEFCPKEPISIGMQITEEDVSSLVNLVRDYFLLRPALCAYDEESGEICGICIVYGHDFEQPDVKMPPKMSQILRFLGTFTDEIKSHGGSFQYICGLIVCIKSKFARLGIAGALYQKRMEISRQDGCKYYFITCTSAFTARALTKLGAKMIKEVDYTQYVDPICGEQIFRNTPDPHRSAKLMCLE